MQTKKTIEHHDGTSVSASDRIDYVVTVKRPATTALAALNRAETYEILKANATERLADITRGLEEKGVLAEVFKIEAPTVFNRLFITCTPKVAQCLEQLASVVSVTRFPPFRVQFFSQGDG